MNSTEGEATGVKDDATLAISIFAIASVVIIILIYYLWRYRQIFGFEDKR